MTATYQGSVIRQIKLQISWEKVENTRLNQLTGSCTSFFFFWANTLRETQGKQELLLPLHHFQKNDHEW